MKQRECNHCHTVKPIEDFVSHTGKHIYKNCKLCREGYKESANKRWKGRQVNWMKLLYGV